MKSDSQQKSELYLHFIERIHATMLATGVSINRTYLLQCICCIITILVSFGFARSGSQLSIGGLTLYVPAWMIVIGFSLIVAALFSYLVGLSKHLLRLRQLVEHLYTEIGYTKPQATTSTAHPLEYPDISSVIADISDGLESRFLRIVSGIANLPILIITLLLFPAVAQMSVAYYLIRSFGWTWLGTAYIVFIIVGTLINGAAFLLASKPVPTIKAEMII